jgi:hypothetical protein
MRQFRDRPHRSHFHRLVDGRRADVQRAPEHEGEAQDIVDLVRIVRTAGADDGVGAHRLGIFRTNFRFGIGHGENQRILRHGLDHLRFQHPRRGQAEENVGSHHHIGQGARVRHLRVARLGGVQTLASGVDHALAVDREDILRIEAEAHQQVEAGDRRGAGAGADQPDFRDVLADHAHAVQHRCTGDDRRAVLVIVEDRDLHPFAQPGFDVEALRRLDVFQVDAAKSRLQRGDDVDQLVGIVLGDLDVEDIDAGELLEQHALAFHHRLAGQRPDVAQAEHRGAVGDDRDQVGARSVQGGR